RTNSGSHRHARRARAIGPQGLAPYEDGPRVQGHTDRCDGTLGGRSCQLPFHDETDGMRVVAHANVRPGRLTPPPLSWAAFPRWPRSILGGAAERSDAAAAR